MDTEVAIVGGGLIGGSLAVALANAGVKVTLIDAAARTKKASENSELALDAPFQGRVFALRPGSRDFLDSCGIWRYVNSLRVAPVYKMEITGDDGHSQLTFDAYRCGLAELAVIVENESLQNAIQSALEERTLVHQVRGRLCTGASWQGGDVRLTLDDGKTISPQLAVAADGANSPLRELAGIRVKQFAYGQRAVVANFSTSVSHDGIAHQWFRSDGVLALLPLPGNRVSMVWSTGEEHACELGSLSHDQLATRVSEASGAMLGDLEVMGEMATFPLSFMRAYTIVGSRLALVGDAAHNVHPLAGQGLNLGLADVRSLAAMIAQRGPDAIGSRAVLSRYRRSRAEETAAMQFTTDGLFRLFDSSQPGIPWLRNTGLKLTEHMAPLKRFLVKRAAN